MGVKKGWLEEAKSWKKEGLEDEGRTEGRDDATKG